MYVYCVSCKGGPLVAFSEKSIAIASIKETYSEIKGCTFEVQQGADFDFVTVKGHGEIIEYRITKLFIRSHIEHL